MLSLFGLIMRDLQKIIKMSFDIYMYVNIPTRIKLLQIIR
jgi:hypothetical protein